MWEEFGFSDNPYSARPIEGNEEGKRLLVGRDTEKKQLRMYIRSSHTHPTLEGPNGVGKTSLVSVAGFELFEDFKAGNGEAFIQLEKTFQLSSDHKLHEFKQEVYFEIAKAFIKHSEILKEHQFNAPVVEEIKQWLNDPIFKNYGGGASFAGFGGNATKSSVPNVSQGFIQSGFGSTIETWLKDCFTSGKKGGFICVIDNLELLETSKNARELLEAIRDELLNIKGLRWVLCGARGIVRSSASSPRLQGVLAEPIAISPISDASAQEALSRRIEEYSTKEANAPVETAGFKHLYHIAHRNLRNSLKYCEDFAFWMYSNAKDTSAHQEKLDLLEVWMAETATKYEEDTRGVGERAWKVFDDLIAAGGTASPSDYEQFGYDNQQAMRPQLKLLEDAHLIESAVDETDKRRRTIIITSRGWIVNYKRKGFKSSVEVEHKV